MVAPTSGSGSWLEFRRLESSRTGRAVEHPGLAWSILRTCELALSITARQTVVTVGAGLIVAEVERNAPEGNIESISWGGQDLNLRPTDYESAALTN
jgi:hypothetical protein